MPRSSAVRSLSLPPGLIRPRGRFKRSISRQRLQGSIGGALLYQFTRTRPRHVTGAPSNSARATERTKPVASSRRMGRSLMVPTTCRSRPSQSRGSRAFHRPSTTPASPGDAEQPPGEPAQTRSTPGQAKRDDRQSQAHHARGQRRQPLHGKHAGQQHQARHDRTAPALHDAPSIPVEADRLVRGYPRSGGNPCRWRLNRIACEPVQSLRGGQKPPLPASPSQGGGAKSMPALTPSPARRGGLGKGACDHSVTLNRLQEYRRSSPHLLLQHAVVQHQRAIHPRRQSECRGSPG